MAKRLSNLRQPLCGKASQTLLHHAGRRLSIFFIFQYLPKSLYCKGFRKKLLAFVYLFSPFLWCSVAKWWPNGLSRYAQSCSIYAAASCHHQSLPSCFRLFTKYPGHSFDCNQPHLARLAIFSFIEAWRVSFLPCAGLSNRSVRLAPALCRFCCSHHNFQCLSTVHLHATPSMSYRL